MTDRASFELTQATSITEEEFDVTIRVLAWLKHGVPDGFPRVYEGVQRTILYASAVRRQLREKGQAREEEQR